MGIYFRESKAPREIRSGPCTAAEGEEMSDGDAELTQGQSKDDPVHKAKILD